MADARFPLTLASALLLASLAGCVVPEPGGDAGSGTVAFYVKDAPLDLLDGVHVTFTKVEVHRAGAGDGNDSASAASTGDGDDEDDGDDDATAPPGHETAPGNGTGNVTTPGNETGSQTGNGTVQTQSAHDARAGWHVVFDGNATVNLMNYSGDARAFLGGEDVPSGPYTQIRIHVREAWVTFVDSNETGELRLPSGTLKIVRPWTVEDGGVTALTVDFDLDRSVHRTGQGDWMLKPVLKLSVEKASGGGSGYGDDGDAASAAAKGKGKGSGNGSATAGDGDETGSPSDGRAKGPPENKTKGKPAS